MYRIKELEGSEDLSGFSTWLGHQGVKHEITRESDVQVLWLADPAHTEPVLTALDQYMTRDDVRQQVNQASRAPIRGGRWQPAPRILPLPMTRPGPGSFRRQALPPAVSVEGLWFLLLSSSPPTCFSSS